MDYNLDSRKLLMCGEFNFGEKIHIELLKLDDEDANFKPLSGQGFEATSLHVGEKISGLEIYENDSFYAVNDPILDTHIIM
jgi:hypothetical protein